MSAKTRYVLWLIGLGLVDMVLPIPILCLILLFVVLERPAWFRTAVQHIYRSS
jgi:hypothetical protein